MGDTVAGMVASAGEALRKAVGGLGDEGGNTLVLDEQIPVDRVELVRIDDQGIFGIVPWFRSPAEVLRGLSDEGQNSQKLQISAINRYPFMG